MDDEQDRAKAFSRWPLLLGSIVAFGAGIGLNLADEPTYAVASILVGMGAAAFGAFVYAEGARHRDWVHRQRDNASGPSDQEQP